MATIILGIADPHFSDRRPRSRKDDFLETQRRKLRDVLKLAAGVRWGGRRQPAAAIVVAGDFFNQPKGKLISRRLDHRLMEIFSESPCPVLGIAGNHDMDRDRLESLEDHPLGTLVAAKLVKLVHWPEYVVVGEEPPVIVTGKPYEVRGPGGWLEGLRLTGAMRGVRAKERANRGRECPALGVTHCFWGPTEGVHRGGEAVVGHSQLLGTGIDINLYGHPHQDDGVTELFEEDGSKVSVCGPGALIRGTLAEHDVKREPKIAVCVFESDGTHKVLTVAIPHEPAERVFDLEKHERVRREKDAEERFVAELGRLRAQALSPEDAFRAAEASVEPEVVALARQFYAEAEGEG